MMLKTVSRLNHATIAMVALCWVAIVSIARPTHGQDVLLAAAEPAGSVEPNDIVAAQQSMVNSDAPLPEAENAGESVAATSGSEISAVPRRFHYLLRATVRGLYDDNINVSHDNRVEDFVTAIEPGIMLGFGDIVGQQENYLQFIYAPSILLYTDHDEANSVQHLLHLEGQYRFRRLTLNLAQDVSILDGANIEIQTRSNTGTDIANVDVGGRTRVNIYSTQLSAAYFLTGKLFLSSQLGASIYDYETLISSESYFANLFLNYTYSPKLTIGAGGGAGFNDVDEPNPDQTFEQASLRVKYQLSDKVDFNGSAGIEFRQFEGEGRGTYISPVFDLGLNWKPFDGTSIAVTGGRRTMNSAVLAAQNYSSTRVAVNVRQRFVRRFTLGLSAGYENSDYFSTVSDVDSTRTDDYFFVQPSVDVTVTRFWTMGAYYLRREDNSSIGSFSFYDNQYGFRTSFTF